MGWQDFSARTADCYQVELARAALGLRSGFPSVPGRPSPRSVVNASLLKAPLSSAVAIPLLKTPHQLGCC